MALFYLLHFSEGNAATRLTRRETQVADAPDKEEGDKQPEAVKPGPSSRVTVTVVSLAALAVIGAAAGNSLPNHEYFALPKFDGFSLPKLEIALPNFDHFSWPNFKRFASQHSYRPAAPPPMQTVSVPIPDPIVRAILRDVQTTQEQHTAALGSLTQSAENQQTDLRRISRQLNSLAAQVSALHGAVGPLTTGSIPQTNPRARVLRTSRRTATVTPVTLATPPLPKPVGPVSVGGAPLGSASASGSGV
jgi:hypothetical protein